MRLYIKCHRGDTYMPLVKDEETAKSVLLKISTSDAMVYLEEINMTIDARHILIACPYSLIDRKQQGANDV